MHFFFQICICICLLFQILLWAITDYWVEFPVLYHHLYWLCVRACVCSVAQSCLTLCDPTDCRLPSSPAHGISQARILEWVAISFSRESSRPRDQIQVTCASCIGRQIPYHCTTWEAQFLPMDCSPPGSSVPGILQARILEWAAFPFSTGPSQPRDQTQLSCVAGRFFTIWATSFYGLWTLCHS